MQMWVRCNETLGWKVNDRSVIEQIQSRQLTAEVELEFEARIDKRVENVEDYEDHYG